MQSISMQRTTIYGFSFLLILLGVVLFIPRVKAETLYTINEQVWQGTDVAVSPAVSQRIGLPLANPDNLEVNIGIVSFYATSTPNCTDCYVDLRNENNNILATSNTRTITASGWTDFTFPTPYHIDQYTLASDTPEFIVLWSPTVSIQIAGTKQFNYGSPYYGTFNLTQKGSATTIYTYGQYSSIYPYQNDTTGSTYQQLAFRILPTPLNQLLTIQYPTERSTIVPPITAYGTCSSSSGLDLSVFPSNETPTSTQAFGISLSCSTNVWTLPIGLITQGDWTITASSTSQYATRHFYSLNQSLLLGTTTASTTAEILQAETDFIKWIRGWSCSILGIDPCSFIGNKLADAWITAKNILLGAQYALIHRPPLGYVTQVYEAVSSGLNVYGTTTPLAFTANVYDTNVELFNSSTTPSIILDQSGWNTLRPYFEMIIYIGFVAWIITRFFL